MTAAAAMGRPALALVETGQGPAMLFQHGLCGDARQPADVFPLETFRCLTVECRGHGGSAPGDPEAFGIATFAEDIAAMFDERRLGPLPVGGISMGAAIALRLAVIRPDLVSALVLARPAWVTTPGPENMRPNAEVGNLLADHDPAEARAVFEAGDTAARLAAHAPDNLASLRSFFSRVPLSTSALLTRISADGPGVSRERVAGLIPGSQLSIIPPKADDLDRYRTAFRGMMADGYTRASGRMAMMIAQNGPGITNFVSPVKTAFWNHTPLLLVTPQAANRTLGQGGFQEVEQMALFRDMVAYQEEVRDLSRIAVVLDRVIMQARRASAPAQINVRAITGHR